MKRPLEELNEKLSRVGLKVRGGFAVHEDDMLASLVTNKDKLSLILVGNIGSSIWPFFHASQEFNDGADHPMDRWSRRIGDQLATDLKGKALYPFEGPPYWPFLTWAQQADKLIQSPLGLNLHTTYGLWHAYRFALLLPLSIDAVELESNDTGLSFDCSSCTSQPCLHSCPVNAFDGESYDTGQCVSFLSNEPDSHCNSHGCLARHACPVGQQFAYDPEHAGFHMQAFKKSYHLL